MSTAYVIGYDPGGRDKHGLAALRVERRADRWEPVHLAVTTAGVLRDVVDWVGDICCGARIVAAGVDTLTEWNSGVGGWRPADLWLRHTYPTVRNRVKVPAALRGAMVVNGAAFLKLLELRFRSDETLLSEAHPKVCYHAVTGNQPNWQNHRKTMTEWLIRELGVGRAEDICVESDHRFDACTAALAALRGLNREWTLDLHALPGEDYSGRIRFCDPTHYWWPDPPPIA